MTTHNAPMTPTEEDREWVRKAYDATPAPSAAPSGDAWTAWSRKVNRRLDRIAQRLATERHNRDSLVAAIGHQLAGLRREIADVKAELATTRTLDAITARLDRLEDAPRAGPTEQARLRIAST